MLHSFQNVYVALYSVIAILHFLGLILLYKAKTNLPNQRLLIKNLSMVEMLFCMSMVIFCSFHVDASSGVIPQCLYAFFSTLFFIEIRLTMLHIIFDRFLEIFTNIKYPLYMSHRKIMFMITLHWCGTVFGAVVSSILRFRGTFTSKWSVETLFCLILDIIILISAVSTYFYFFIKVRKIRKNEASFEPSSEENAMNVLIIKKFRQPCYIVLTYLCFNLSSTIMFTTSLYVNNRRQHELLNGFSHIPIMVGLVSDAFIYVYADRDVRGLLFTILKGKRVLNDFENI